MRQPYRNRLSLQSKVARAVWSVVSTLILAWTPRPLFALRAAALRLFGATIGRDVHVYPGARVWAPWNLTMGDGSCLADGVNCYNVAAIEVGPHAVVSQGAHLCSATHDYQSPGFHLIARPILIEADAWVAADAFVGPGVRIGEGAVVGARAAVFKDVEPWTVVGGNPARFIKQRTLWHCTTEAVQ